MLFNPYKSAIFLKSAAAMKHLPEDTGIEVAFAGRSNAGKSSALNCLTQNKKLARTSKTPGRTQLINLFQLTDEAHRLIDLPGYGYAKVPEQIKLAWQKNLTEYLQKRNSLKGLVIVMDIRHPYKELDQMLVEWAVKRALPVHLLLTKCDKLSRLQAQKTLNQLKKMLAVFESLISIQVFSALKKEGLEELIILLNQWYGFSEPRP